MTQNAHTLMTSRAQEWVRTFTANATAADCDTVDRSKRTNRRVVATISQAFSPALKAAEFLAGLTEAQLADPALSILVQHVYDEILGVETLLAGVDIERLKEDIGYAADWQRPAEIAQASAQAASTLCHYLKDIVTAYEMLRQASARREAYQDPNRPKVKYLRFPQEAVDTDRETPATYPAGFTAEIEHVYQPSDACGAGYGLKGVGSFVPLAFAQQHAEVIER